MEARKAKLQRTGLVSRVPDDAAAPAAILQAIKDLHDTGTGTAPSSATEAVALNGEDGIAISDSNDEEDSDADGLLQTSKYNLFGVVSSPQKQKASASSSGAASSSRAAPKQAPKGMGETSSGQSNTGRVSCLRHTDR